MSAVVLRGDARDLPLPDESVDLIVTSPPYFGQRDYRDGGASLVGQIGAEATPAEYVAALLDCTREWVRVLKPSGSLFVNLGDKYSQRVAARRSSHQDGLFPGRPELRKDWKRDRAAGLARMPYENITDGATGAYVPEKSLIGLPWRYALGCVDDLGLILRAEILWSKPSGLPESVTDRVRRSHEQVFHLVKQPHYYSAVDEIREPHAEVSLKRAMSHRADPGRALRDGLPVDGTGMPAQTLALARMNHPLGKLPGSVWDIATQPLTGVPAELGVTHYAAFPMELPRRVILGWSPPGVCTACGEGRRPVSSACAVDGQSWAQSQQFDRIGQKVPERRTPSALGYRAADRGRAITGYACACTPYTDHPERRGKDFHATTDRAQQGMNDGNGGERYRRYVDELANPRGPVREYDFANWAPAPTRPATILDPFGGTGTTALVADVLGRTGISIDRSADYCRLARWRTTDPGERARAMQVPKPELELAGQLDLFGGAAS